MKNLSWNIDNYCLYELIQNPSATYINITMYQFIHPPITSKYESFTAKIQTAVRQLILLFQCLNAVLGIIYQNVLFFFQFSLSKNCDITLLWLFFLPTPRREQKKTWLWGRRRSRCRRSRRRRLRHRRSRRRRSLSSCVSSYFSTVSPLVLL